MLLGFRSTVNRTRDAKELLYSSRPIVNGRGSPVGRVFRSLFHAADTSRTLFDRTADNGVRAGSPWHRGSLVVIKPLKMGTLDAKELAKLNHVRTPAPRVAYYTLTCYLASRSEPTPRVFEILNIFENV